MSGQTGGEDGKKVLTLSGGALRRPGPAAPTSGETRSVKQQFSHGRQQTVQVEVKRERGAAAAAAAGAARPGVGAPAPRPGAGAAPAQPGARAPLTLNRAAPAAGTEPAVPPVPAAAPSGTTPAAAPPTAPAAPAGRQLSRAEMEARQRALQEAHAEDEARTRLEAEARARAAAEAQAREAEAAARAAEPPRQLTPAELREREIAEMRRIQEDDRRAAEEAAVKRKADEAKRLQAAEAAKKADDERRRIAARAGDSAAAKAAALAGRIPGLAATLDDSGAGLTQADRSPRPGMGGAGAGPGGMRRPGGPGGARGPAPRPQLKVTRDRSEIASANERRLQGKLTLDQVMTQADSEKVRSVAAFRRARERERQRMMGDGGEPKVARDVTIPEFITVQDLANRMAERSGDVVKLLMRMGVMATINQTIDADTAELIAGEFGHRIRRVAESDVEIGMVGIEDTPEQLQPRPPVVTIMGHVDHGKTSLLDAVRKTDVVSGEAGGITQHIGAYQITAPSGQKITFIDTPGHAAFTEMRARGANVTDIVILVVAANDGIMPQTVEAIAHAKAAQVPIIVAVNKVDLPDSDPAKVRQSLLQYELQTEDFGGDVLAVDVSAKTRLGLDKLMEAVLLQSEILELKANPDRPGQARVVEAKLDRGRGPVATVLVQKGTLKVGDVFVTGAEWGRVRALTDDRGRAMKQAGPATPVEVLGANAVPGAGDDFIVVDDEARAREIAEFRQRRKRQEQNAAAARGSVEQMLKDIQAGEKKELSVVVKGDVQGSIEAIVGALNKFSAEQSEVGLRVLHQGVGAISEADVTLAKASDGLILGFNVRAVAQARDIAKRDGVEIRYYSIIYELLDDIRGLLSGLLAPTLRENFLGNAEIRAVFDITRIGKVAGCMVTEGVVRRGAKVRLLRDNVVIHEGTLKTLRRFKDEVREVARGFECGMAFENYDGIKQGDVIECFEIEQIARTL